ncbi:hypothetical protein JTB14_018692 [Gonioctena quinquepunctata]|nr:hypothetical protein JTB14_018692 [Gonioctena quinquepunctata]
MLYSEPIATKCCNVVDNTNISTDHFFINITFTVTNYIPPVDCIVLRNLKKINIESFNRDLDITPFWHIFDVEDIDSKVGKLNELILSLFDKHLPEHTIKGKKMRKLRDQALQKFKRTKSHSHWD